MSFITPQEVPQAKIDPSLLLPELLQLLVPQQPDWTSAYKAAQECYLKFYRDGNVDPLRLTQSILLSTVQKSSNIGRNGRPVYGVVFPQLQQVMRGGASNEHRQIKVWA